MNDRVLRASLSSPTKVGPHARGEATARPGFTTTFGTPPGLDGIDREFMLTHEGVGFRTREDAGGRPDRADAARADGARKLEAIEFAETLDQPRNVASVEGVASPGSINECDRIGAEPCTKRVGNDHGTLFSTSDHNTPGAKCVERLGLTHGIALAED